jgi:hypothetical protein
MSVYPQSVARRFLVVGQSDDPPPDFCRPTNQVVVWLQNQGIPHEKSQTDALRRRGFGRAYLPIFSLHFRNSN